MVDIEAQKENYEGLTTELLQWIEQTILKLREKDFPNSLAGMQALMQDFKKFRTELKPAKYVWYFIFGGENFISKGE